MLLKPLESSLDSEKPPGVSGLWSLQCSVYKKEGTLLCFSVRQDKAARKVPSEIKPGTWNLRELGTVLIHLVLVPHMFLPLYMFTLYRIYLSYALQFHV